MSRAANGDPEKFYQEVALFWTSDECLFWPFAKAHGYGIMGCPDKTVGLVHRRLCQDTHGEPMENQIALHSCGQGHLGCVNQKHLRWGTRSENMADAVKHGRVKSNIDENLVRLLRQLKGSKSINALADEFGVSPASIGNIFSGKSWSWVE